MQLPEIIFTKMLLLYDINRIKYHKNEEGRIEATIGWPDQGQIFYDENEEIQLVHWDYNQNLVSIDVSLVLEYLLINKLTYLGLIRIAKETLSQKIASYYTWEIARADSAINTVLNISIDRIDDGEKTDAFFLLFRYPTV